MPTVKKSVCQYVSPGGPSLFPSDAAFRRVTLVKGGHFECSQCPRVLRSEEQVTKHDGFHETGAGIQCPLCLGLFSNSTNLQRHLDIYKGASDQSHSRSLSHECSACEAKFSTKLRRQVHEAVDHEGRPVFTCYGCPMLALSFDTIERHLHRMPLSHRAPAAAFGWDEFFRGRDKKKRKRSLSADAHPISSSDESAASEGDRREQPREEEEDEYVRVPLRAFASGTPVVPLKRLSSRVGFPARDELPSRRDGHAPLAPPGGQTDKKLGSDNAPSAFQRPPNIFGAPASSAFPNSHASLELPQRSEVKGRRVPEDSGDVKPITCTACRGVWYSAIAFTAHPCMVDSAQQDQRLVGMNQCEYCARYFSSDAKKYSHYATHIGVNNFSCGECGHRFPNLAVLGSHMQAHRSWKYSEMLSA